MNNDLTKAQSILESGNYTCVMCNANSVFADDRRGIRPLLTFYRSDHDLHGFSAADKIVGKAAAFLYLLLGVDAVYAAIISTPAKRVLESAGIAVSYGREVSAIRDRAGTGYCPMETAVWDIEDPKTALSAVEEALSKL